MVICRSCITSSRAAWVLAGARLILGAVDHIDPASRRIRVAEQEVGYDIASIDVGITGHLPGVAGFADHGVPVKPFAEFSTAWETYQQGPRGAIAVVGGGLGGVELALAMRARLGVDVAIRVVGRSGISGAGPALKRLLRKEMLRAGVEMITGEAVALSEDHLHLADGRQIPAVFCVGAAGATPQPWLAQCDLPLHEGFIKVGPSLQVLGHKTLFAAGDCAHLTHDPRPKAGVYAVRAAKVLYHNLSALSMGRDAGLRDFHPQAHVLRLVALGHGRAVAEKWPKLPVAPAGRLIWRWKDRIDRSFMRILQDVPPVTLPRGSGDGG